MRAKNGWVRSFKNPVTLEGATVSVNLDTNVVVMRQGSWGDDAVVTRAGSQDEAIAAAHNYERRLGRIGFEFGATERTIDGEAVRS